MGSGSGSNSVQLLGNGMGCEAGRVAQRLVRHGQHVKIWQRELQETGFFR